MIKKEQIIRELIQIIEIEWGVMSTRSSIVDVRLDNLMFWNSLNALILLAIIEKKYGVDFPIQLIRSDVTIDTIANQIAELLSNE